MTVSVDIHSANDLAIWLDVYKDNLENSRDLDQRIRSFDARMFIFHSSRTLNALNLT